MSTETQAIQELATGEYKYGFVTDVEADAFPPGLSEDVIRRLSARKGEPDWMLDWRLKAYRTWLTLKDPDWANVRHDPIDYQNIIYYSAPKRPKALASLDELGSGDQANLRKARHSHRRTEGPGGRGG